MTLIINVVLKIAIKGKQPGQFGERMRSRFGAVVSGKFVYVLACVAVFGLSGCAGDRGSASKKSDANLKTKNVEAGEASVQVPSKAFKKFADDSPEPIPEKHPTYTEEEEVYLKQEDAWIELLDGLDLDTVEKPKKALVTPYGVKNVYDPYQDPVVKVVFKKLYEERQESDYFDDWPETFIERSQRKKARKHLYFGSRDVYPRAADILRNARYAQRNDYARARCRGIEQLSCLDPNVSIRRFRSCPSESGIAWGSGRLSECENEYNLWLSEQNLEEEIPLSKWPIPGVPKLCLFDEDLPSVPRPDGYNDRYLPFHIAQIGDPMRGTVEQQFDQYFAINCPKFQNITSQ